MKRNICGMLLAVCIVIAAVSVKVEAEYHCGWILDFNYYAVCTGNDEPLVLRSVEKRDAMGYHTEGDLIQSEEKAKAFLQRRGHRGYTANRVLEEECCREGCDLEEIEEHCEDR